MSTRNGEPNAPDQPPVADRAKPAFSRAERIGILAAVLTSVALLALVYPWQLNRKGTRGNMEAKIQITVFRTALETFKKDTGRYPTTREGLRTLMQESESIKGWRGPYLLRIPYDPWGSPYVYVCPSKHNPDSFDLHSLGPSGRDGADDNIDNWTVR